MYALHGGRFGSRPKRYSRRKKSLKLKLYMACPTFSTSRSGAIEPSGVCTSAMLRRVVLLYGCGATAVVKAVKANRLQD